MDFSQDLQIREEGFAAVDDDDEGRSLSIVNRQYPSVYTCVTNSVGSGHKQRVLLLIALMEKLRWNQFDKHMHNLLYVWRLHMESFLLKLLFLRNIVSFEKMPLLNHIKKRCTRSLLHIIKR